MRACSSAPARLGSYTTFSTWMVETQRIEEAGKRRIAVANVVLSIALGLAAAALGRCPRRSQRLSLRTRFVADHARRRRLPAPAPR